MSAPPTTAAPEGAPERIPERILVVEDDLHTRTLLKELCEGQGYQVEQVADGLSALEKAAAFRPDLILLDLMLPGLDGFGVLERLRKSELFARLPVIILTASGDIAGKIRGIELGADDYVTKPFKLFELTTRVKAALTVRRYRERLQVAEEELSDLRSLDPLTGAGTYPQLRAGLEYEMARARRYGRTLSALLVLLDNFDEVRAELSRAEIDRLSADVALRLRCGLRETDRLFRIDIDEFVAVLPETDAQGAEAARQRMAESFRAAPHQLAVQMGIGVFPSAGVEGPEDVMRAAQRDLEAHGAK